MKNNLLTKPLFLKAFVLFTCFMLVMFYNKSKAQTVAVLAVDNIVSVNVK
jgi:hypothetical protein